MNRTDILIAIREYLEPELWTLVAEIEKTLRGLIKVEHFDCEDSTAVGAAVHSALPSACRLLPEGRSKLSCAQYEIGPSNKLTAKVQVQGTPRRVSIELHNSGPRGGTSKAKHQFAEPDIENEPGLPGLDIEAPADILLFLAYSLTPTKASVDRLHLMFADGIDRKKITLHRPADLQSEGDLAAPADTGTRGTTVKVKAPDPGERDSHAWPPTKRGDAPSST